MKKISVWILLLCLLIQPNLYAQYTTTPTTVSFTESQNQTFLTAGQCVDGGVQVVRDFRMYMGDRVRPFDLYVKGSTAGSQYVDWIRYDANKTNIQLRNGQTDAFDVQGTFNIKSYGNPRNSNEPVLWVRNNSGMVAVDHHPSNTLTAASQLVYYTFIDAFDTTVAGTYSLPSFTYFPSLSVADPLTSALGGTTFATSSAISNKQRVYSDTTAGVECVNYYVSRCGDGYIDQGNATSAGTSTKPGYANHSISLAPGSLANEQCDPGLTSSWSDDVMPGGATPSASYNCTTTCTTNTVAQNTTLTLTKQQRNITTNPSSAFTASPIAFSANDALEFQITVTTTTPGSATNVSITDTLPQGFVLSSAANAVTVNGANTSVVVNASNQFSLNFPGTITHPQTITVLVRGAMTQASNTTANYYNNTVQGTYTNTAGAQIMSPQTVYQTPQSSTTYSVSFTKEQRNATQNNPINGAFTTSNIVYASGDVVVFRLRATNNGTTTIPSTVPVVIRDQLPVGFVITAESSTSVSLGGYRYWQNNGALVPGAVFEVIVTGSLAGTTYQNNTAAAGFITNGNPTITTPNVIVYQDPQSIPPVPPILALTKEVRNVSTSGAFYQADDQASAVPVSGGHVVQYKLTVTRVGGGPVAQTVRVQDYFPTTGLTINSITLNGTTIPNPSTSTFDINLSAADFIGGVTGTILINATVGANAIPGSYNNMTYLFYISPIPIDYDADNAAWVGGNGLSNIILEKTYQEGVNWLDQITRNAGQTFTMRLLVTNTGSASATGVYINDQCDPRISCTSWSIPGTNLSGTITNNLLQTPNIAPVNGLAPGQTIVVLVQGSVLTTAEGSTVPNTGYVYSLPGFTTPIDSDYAEIVSPTLQRAFTIAKTVSGVLATGNTLTYTLTICNSGQANISAYTLTDPLPTGLSYVPNSTIFNSTAAGDPTITNNTLVWGCGMTPNVLPSSCLLTPGSCSTLKFSTLVGSLSPSYANRSSTVSNATASTTSNQSSRGLSQANTPLSQASTSYNNN